VASIICQALGDDDGGSGAGGQVGEEGSSGYLAAAFHTLPEVDAGLVRELSAALKRLGLVVSFYTCTGPLNSWA